MYTVSSAARAIQSGQALGSNVIKLDSPVYTLMYSLTYAVIRIPIIYALIVYVTYPPEHGERPKSINLVNNVTTLIYVSCGFDALDRDTYRLLSWGGVCVCGN